MAITGAKIPVRQPSPARAAFSTSVASQFNSRASVVSETGSTLTADLPIEGGGILNLRFEKNKIFCSLSPKTATPLALAFEWDATKAALTGVEPNRVNYRWQDFDCGVTIEAGRATATPGGWTVVGDERGLVLEMAQRS